MADNPLARFFSREAGQQRRRALNALDQRIGDALGYYLGPQLAPRVGQAANALAMFSPGMDVQEAVQASGEMMAPNRTPLDRAASGAALAGALGAMFMPGGVSSIRQGVEDVADAAVRAYDPNTTNAFTVWHGSPHDFDRFSLDKIGTGEGAQAYGHGLYFAERPETAVFYRDNYAKPEASRFSTESARQMAQDQLQAWAGDIPGGIEDLKSSLRNMETTSRFFGETPDELARMQDLREAIAYMESGAPRGRLYEVSIDANPEDFLDWDKPLREQPEAVRDALTGIYPDDMMGGEIARLMASDARDTAIMRGDNARTSLAASQAAASEGLRELGIPGIRYLDAGSRGAGDGSRNYVVFNDQLLSILNKYGLAGGAALGAGALAMQPGEAQAMPPEASFLEKYLP